MKHRKHVSNYNNVMQKLNVFVYVLLFGLFFLTPNTQAATQAQIDAAQTKAIAWLILNQKFDGSWGNVEGSKIQATATAVGALANAGVTGFSYSRGLAWLANAEASSVDSLSRQILAMSAAGMDTQEKISELLTLRNFRNGWGAYDRYGTSFPDTPLAVLAIRSDNTIYQTEEAKLVAAACEMFEAQKMGVANIAGSWSYMPSIDPSLSSANTSAVIPTVYNLLALSALTDFNFTNINCSGTTYNFDSVVNQAANWLLAQRLNLIDGGFGDDGVSNTLDTALVYQAISMALPGDSSLIGAQDYLINTQYFNGSWNDDALATAMAATTLPSVLIDTDTDGLPDAVEVILGTNPAVADSRGVVDVTSYVIESSVDLDGDGIHNNIDPDDDNDGMPDLFETRYGLNPLSAADATSDTDGDGNNALAEFHAGTDPTDIDSNNTGLPYLHYKLLAHDGQRDDLFGATVAIDGNRALVGAPGGSTGYAEHTAGAAYLYVNDGNGNWRQQAKFIADDGILNDKFGRKVAISGSTVLIASDGSINNYGHLRPGAAYVFTDDGTGTWSQRAKLTVSGETQSTSFASDIALSNSTALISNIFNDGTGAVYVFTDDGTGSWSEQAKLKASDAENGARFGSRIALSGSTALITAIFDDDGGVNSGAAYIFTNDGTGNWSQQVKLTAADAEPGDVFGSSVALLGSRALIGASASDDVASGAGSAYVFTDDGTGSWSNQTKLTAMDPVSNSRFGSSVALFGSTALIGATSGSGAVYLFTDDGASWNQIHKLIARDGSGADNFGRALALSGTTVLVGAASDDDIGYNSGSAYVFELDIDGDGVLNSIDAFPTDPTASVDSDNDGMPDDWEVLYGFDPLDSTDAAIDSDGDGFSNLQEYQNGTNPILILDNDGDGIADGVDPDDDNDGLPDTFESRYGLNPLNAADATSDVDGDSENALAEFHAGTDPTDIDSNSTGIPYEHYKLLAHDGQTHNIFGLSAAIDGNRALIGAPDGYTGVAQYTAGAAYLYINDGAGNWSQQAKFIADDGVIDDRFGQSVALSGSTAMIGAHRNGGAGVQSGAVYVFTDDGTGAWHQQAKLTASETSTGDNFGISVALSASTALIGSVYSGSAYIFVDDGTGNWSEQSKLTPQDATSHFGSSVALSDSTALIGAVFDDNSGVGSGAGYIFIDDGTGNWTQQAKLTAADAEEWDLFGSSVALSDSGLAVLIGAPLSDDTASASGSAYIFTDDGTGSWSNQTKLTAEDPTFNSRFGSSVAFLGSTAFVGATGAISITHPIFGTQSAGAVYLFSDNGIGWDQYHKLTARDGLGHTRFGVSIALAGTTILIGAPGGTDAGYLSGTAYVFELDTDGDSVLNSLDAFPTDPTASVDTDNDGMPDSWEVLYSLNPLVNDSELDADNDGVSNIGEYLAGTNPNPNPQAVPDGDINGDGNVDVVDVLLAQRAMLGSLTLTTEQLSRGDVAPLVDGVPSPNGELNIADVLIIQRKALGLIEFGN